MSAAIALPTASAPSMAPEIKAPAIDIFFMACPSYDD
jgi:hypothetical protein